MRLPVCLGETSGLTIIPRLPGECPCDVPGGGHPAGPQTPGAERSAGGRPVLLTGSHWSYHTGGGRTPPGKT